MVLQQKAGGKAAEAARGTVKASVLEDAGPSTGTIVASCFDQKAFYMISCYAEEISWVECTKTVYSHLLVMIMR